MVSYGIYPKLAVGTSLIGFLKRIGKPAKLAEIHKELKKHGNSKTTLYRHLEQLVEQGILSKQGDRYALISNGNFAVIASDLFRISEMNPIFSISKKGMKISLYSSEELENIEWDEAEKKINEHTMRILEVLDPDINEFFTKENVGKEAISSLIGKNIGFVVTFNGTDFVTLTPEEIINKRRLAMKLISEKKAISLIELMKILNVNLLQIRQIVDPILIAGLANLDESGKISFTIEVNMDENLG